MAVDAAAPSTPAVHARATVRPDKAAAVADLAEAFQTSTATVLTEYRGLSVSQITALRVALGSDTTYSVVKNTLTRLAAAKAGMTGLDDLLAGPTAVAFVGGDPVEAAKALRDYAKVNPALIVKGGVMEGRSISADEIRQLADLESREVLLAKLASAMLGSLSQAVSLFNAPLAQMARVAEALRQAAEQDPTILAGGPAASDGTQPAEPAAETDAPAPAAPAEDAPTPAPADDAAAVSSAAPTDDSTPEPVEGVAVAAPIVDPELTADPASAAGEADRPDADQVSTP